MISGVKFDETPRGHDALYRAAVFDDQRKYRYWLAREWRTEGPWLTLCTLKPTGADHFDDDRHVVKWMRWARNSLGFSSLRVVSLFGLLCHDLKDLERVDDPVGPHNDHYIQHELTEAAADRGSRFVCAWGEFGIFQHRAATVLAMAREIGCPVWCIGINKNSTPLLNIGYKSRLLPYQQTQGG